MPSETALLQEYSAAQASAQHHDTLVWTVTNVLWALSILLFGFSISVLDKPFAKIDGIRVLLTFLCVVGIALLSFA